MDITGSLKPGAIMLPIKKPIKIKGTGRAALLFTYDLNIRLLEAAYLLYYNASNTTSSRAAINKKQLDEERKALGAFPEKLLLKELLNPYKAIRKIFKKHYLQQYRDHLHEWLYAALYKKGGDDELEEKEINMVYRNLLKLYALAWLIYQREIENKGMKVG